MKINKLMAAFAAVAVVFAACSKEENETTYTLSPKTADVLVGETVQFTIEPAATATWSVSDESVASIDQNGLATGLAAGQILVSADVDGTKLSAVLNVKEPAQGGEPAVKLHASLQHSEYYVFQLDDLSFEQIKGKVKADLRANDSGDGSNTHSFYIWNATYSAGTTSGLNFYDKAEGWYSFQVLSAGWSGGGLNIHDVEGIEGGVADMDPLAAIMANPSDYVFHIAMKSTDQASHAVQLGGAAGSKGTVTIGATPFVDGSATYAVAGDFPRDGGWGEIEIPMTTFTNQGLQYASNNVGEGINALVFLSGGVANVMLQFDACFIYKK
ncbi:MAG: Ig-like domain-containing protein [Paludibacteraceae bacterium]|nr:Ig-like domain-containing protein [Paludibacteraceae bacterium]